MQPRSLENHVAAHRTGNHLAVLKDLRIRGSDASTGFGRATHAREHAAGNGCVQILDRELEVRRGRGIGQHYMDRPSGSGVEKRSQKSAVHLPALVAVFTSRHHLNDGFVCVCAYIGESQQSRERSWAIPIVSRYRRHGRTLVT